MKYLGNNWIEGETGGHYWQAKVYAEPSTYGIKNGRVSKLCISKGNKWEGLGNTIFNYDRGLDFDNSPNGLVEKIINEAQKEFDKHLK